MSESWFYHISQEGILLRVATVDAALTAAKDGGFLWLTLLPANKGGTLEPHRTPGSPSAFH